jgi:acyl-CoA thioesterase
MQRHLEIVKKRFEQDNYTNSLGIILDELTEDTVQMHMELREDMLNWFGRPHGGAIYSLADAAFSVLGNNTNNLAVALDCSITFHASPDLETILIVEGEILSTTVRTAAYLFKVYMEKNGIRTLVATMKSVSYQTGNPIDPDVEQIKR